MKIAVPRCCFCISHFQTRKTLTASEDHTEQNVTESKLTSKASKMKWENAVSFFNNNTSELNKEAMTAFQCSGGVVVIHHHHTCSITFCSRIIVIYLKWEWGKKMTSIYHSSSSSICWLGVWIQKFQLIIHNLKLFSVTVLDCIVSVKKDA